jgi:hypothetical protein
MRFQSCEYPFLYSYLTFHVLFHWIRVSLCAWQASSSTVCCYCTSQSGFTESLSFIKWGCCFHVNMLLGSVCILLKINFYATYYFWCYFTLFITGSLQVLGARCVVDIKNGFLRFVIVVWVWAYWCQLWGETKSPIIASCYANCILSNEGEIEVSGEKCSATPVPVCAPQILEGPLWDWTCTSMPWSLQLIVSYGNSGISVIPGAVQIFTWLPASPFFSRSVARQFLGWCQFHILPHNYCLLLCCTCGQPNEWAALRQQAG